jgi:hypothetical protein
MRVLILQWTGRHTSHISEDSYVGKSKIMIDMNTSMFGFSDLPLGQILISLANTSGAVD